MRLLEKKILNSAESIQDEVLNVDSFMSQSVDTELMKEIGIEFEHRFGSKKIDRILTVESAGIPIAMATAILLRVPFVFARKNPDPLMHGDSFLMPVYSCSKEAHYHLSLLRKMLPAGENVLILDSFLSHGETMMCLVNMVKQAGCNLVGVGAVIEKGYRNGRERLEKAGCRVETLSCIEEIKDGKPVFKKRT